MNDPRVVTTFDSFRTAFESWADGNPDESSTSVHSELRVPVEVRVTVSDPYLAYRRARDGPGGVFLETTGGQTGWGYFGVDPECRLRVGRNAVEWATKSSDSPRSTNESTASTSDGSATPTPDESPASTSDESVEPTSENSTPGFTEGSETAPSSSNSTQPTAPTLAALEGILDGESIARGDCDVPYPCGVVGWLSYDIARELEALPASAEDDRHLPRLEAATFDRFAAWEEPVDGPVELRITSCPQIDISHLQRDHSRDHSRVDSVGSVLEDALRKAYERGRSRSLELAEAVREGDSSVDESTGGVSSVTFTSDCGRDAFADRVRRVKEYIRDGDTFQANISQRLVAPAAVHPIAVYDAIRRVNPAPYSCLLEFESADLLSASPELLLERDGSFVRTEPIAGTRPRGDTAAADEAYETELLGDEKERAEHAMLVDLERNDLGKVCEYGSVVVDEYRRVDRYSEVMHLVSNVTGHLKQDATLADTIAAVFPGGTITGAPKPRTMEIIDEVEATRRGPYTGSVGIFGFDGRATLNIIIRTLVRNNDEYHLRVGAGIVSDSDPSREYDETLDKARALVNAVDESLGDRAAMTVETSVESSTGAGEP